MKPTSVICPTPIPHASAFTDRPSVVGEGQLPVASHRRDIPAPPADWPQRYAAPNCGWYTNGRMMVLALELIKRLAQLRPSQPLRIITVPGLQPADCCRLPNAPPSLPPNWLYVSPGPIDHHIGVVSLNLPETRGRSAGWSTSTAGVGV